MEKVFETFVHVPFFLVLSRETHLLIDLCFVINPQGHNSKTHSQCVRDLQKRLRQAYVLASKNNAEKCQMLNRRRWDANVRFALNSLMRVSLVMCLVLGMEWAEWGLHYNLLLLFGFLPVSLEVEGAKDLTFAVL